MKLKDKKAYITGGSSGIGAAIAVLFAKEGADISFCHFKDDIKATSVNDKITGYNRKCFSQNIDIGKKDNCDDFFQRSLKRHLNYLHLVKHEILLVENHMRNLHTLKTSQ